MKAIVVQSEGKKVTATVAEKSKVKVATKSQIDETIQTGAAEIMAMLSGEMVDPTKKRCSRCVKMGRVPYHNLNDFSLLKNGKRHSQCKVCRTEQANEWCTKRAEHRRAYHKKYHEGRPRRVVTPKALTALVALYEQEDKVAKDALDASNALFIGFTDSDIQTTN